jgi:hypothetical protein
MLVIHFLKNSYLINAFCRFNISTDDIYRAISDNTASAVSASRMITNQRAVNSQKIYCMMHTVDLAVKHALGICVRRKQKMVLDKSLALKQLRTRAKGLCAYIMDKHNKSRFEEFKKFLKCIGDVNVHNLKSQMPHE